MTLDGNGWETSAQAWIEAMGDTGDFGRMHVLDAPMMERVRRGSFETALDVGCGEGRFCRMLRDAGITAVGIAAGQPQLMRDPIGPPDAVPAIGRAAQVEAVEIGELDGRSVRVDYMRDGQQHEGARMHARRPERSLQISRRIGVAWETANPSGGQAISVVSRSAFRSATAFGSLGDIRGLSPADRPSTTLAHGP